MMCSVITAKIDVIKAETREHNNRDIRKTIPNSVKEWQEFRNTLMDLDDLLDYYAVDASVEVLDNVLKDRAEHNVAIKRIIEHGHHRRKYTRIIAINKLDMVGIKRCKCGSPAMLVKVVGEKRYLVMCRWCNVQTIQADTKDAAIELWNDRAYAAVNLLKDNIYGTY